MKSSIIIVSILVATFLQAEGRSVDKDEERTKVLAATMEQAFVCGMKMGPIKVSQLPPISGKEELPTDNSALNELWGCIWEMKGIIDEQGDLQDDKLESYIVDLISVFETPESGELTATHDMVEQCKDTSGTDYGQTAVMIQNCINGF